MNASQKTYYAERVTKLREDAISLAREISQVTSIEGSVGDGGEDCRDHVYVSGGEAIVTLSLLGAALDDAAKKVGIGAWVAR